MRSQTLWTIIVGVLVIASALFMAWAALRPLETAPAPVADPPTPTSSPPTHNAWQEGGVWQEGEGTLDLDWVTFSMPAGWRYVVKQWPDDPPFDMQDVAPLLIAWRGAETFADSILRFTLVAIPRNDLSLERYLEDVRSQLAEDESVSDVAARLATDLRPDGLPVALVSYRVATQLGRMVGHQVAALDATGEQLLIATLVQPEEDGMQLLRSFTGAMQFGE